MPTPPHARLIGGGQYNGYIGVYRPAGMDGELYDEWKAVMDNLMYGGCTFDRLCGDESFRANEIIPVTEIPNDWSSYMIFGFDTMHWGDGWSYWTLERVTEEVKGILKQIDDAEAYVRIMR